MADRPHDACSSTGCYKRKSVKSAFFEGGGSHWVQISDGRECRPPTALGDRKQEWLPLRAVPYQSIRSALFETRVIAPSCGTVSKYPQCIVWFCHKARVWHTDRWTELWLPRLC